MKDIVAMATTFALLVLAKAADPSVNLEYYKDIACSSTSLSAVTLSTSSGSCSACQNLQYAGKSFHIGSPATEKQVPQGCEIIGYTEKGCTGAINLQIHGPSKEGTCYAATKGDKVSVESMRLLCL